MRISVSSWATTDEDVDRQLGGNSASRFQNTTNGIVQKQKNRTASQLRPFDSAYRPLTGKVNMTQLICTIYHNL